jgi:hypothetical protein
VHRIRFYLGYWGHFVQRMQRTPSVVRATTTIPEGP